MTEWSKPPKWEPVGQGIAPRGDGFADFLTITEGKQKPPWWEPIGGKLSVDERVEHIMYLVLDGKWRRGRSVLELSREWGVAPANVTQAHAAALRFLRIFAGQEEHIRDSILQMIESGIEMAEKAKGHLVSRDGIEEFDNPDLKVRLEYLRFYVEMLGLIPKEKPAGEGPSEDVPLEELGNVLGKIGFQIVRKQPEVGSTPDRRDDDTEAEQSAEDPQPGGARGKRKRRSPEGSGQAET